MSELREKGRAHIEGRICLLSGLHIGAGKDSVEIGGIDNPVIKHPLTDEPYIPGSSIKGRLRFLMEWAFGTIRDDGHAWGYDDKQPPIDPADPVLRIFGNALKEWRYGPTRLIVRDCPLTEDDRSRYHEAPDRFFEQKTEVLIDRIKGKAHDVGPRQTERVPAGVTFTFETVFRLYDTGDSGARDLDCLNWTLLGLSLLEQDALGGSGSRGYGRIRFEDLRLVTPNEVKLPLDNRFCGHRFDRDKPPAIIAAAELFGGST
jgi:CRISPR-associated protein Csm3